MTSLIRHIHEYSNDLGFIARSYKCHLRSVKNVNKKTIALPNYFGLFMLT